jgi:alkanesulfonate monooxygenase SsuD/methylene tetrahydromethanopterin reductase-like flavin-dependent oxidoreductase (luciferase family)
VEKLSSEGYIAVGDPDDCANAMRQWQDIGVDQMTFSPTTNTLSTEVVMASMELFGREVIPQFDTDPVHSTTRYRTEAAGLPAVTSA